MPIDISLVSSNVVITEASGHKKGWKPMSASYEFDANNNLLLTINGQTRSIGLADLTVSGAAPATVNAAITALAAVFLNAGGAATSTFTALSGTAWDGTNKYTTLTANTALTLSVGSNVSGILNVYQDATGSRTLSINGVSFTINTAANSVTGIGYYVTNGVINFTVDTGLIQYTPDVTAPIVNSLTATDSHTIQAAMSESVSGTTAGWSFTQNGTTITPTSVSGATTRSFVFAQTFVSTDVFTASYNSATGDTLDAAGNELVTFSGVAVTNGIQAIDTDAQAYWQAEEAAAGITIDSTNRTAINSLFLALKAGSNVWAKTKGIYPGYGTGLKNGKNLSLNATTVNSPTINSLGYVFDGVNDAINTNIIPATHLASQAEFHGIYVKSSTDDKPVFGSLDAGKGHYLFPRSTGNAIWRVQNGGDINGGANATATGRYIIALRATAPAQRATKNGTQINANATTSAGLSTYPIYLGANNNSGTISSFNSCTLGLYIVGLDLTDTQMAELDTAIANFITATSRA